MQVKTFICNMLHENCYLVYDEQSREAAIIDPGFYWDNEKQQLTRYVCDNELEVKYLLCTHLHFDHIFGVPFIEDTFGVKLSASPFDTPWLDNFPQMVARFGIHCNEMPRPIGHPLHDGDILTLGTHTLECISTPGHSAGGMCFFSKEEAKLFAGDTLFQCSIGRTDFSDGNYGQLIHSIQTRLLSLPSHTIVYPGHGDTTTIENEMKYNLYL